MHCHILPGMDDGAEDWTQSLEMAGIAVEDGISGIVCTPHCSPVFPGNSRSRIMAAVEMLRMRVFEAGIGIDLYPGCELSIQPTLADKIEAEESLTVNDCRNVALIEMPPDLISPNLDKFFSMMRVRGVRTVLAHPERNPHLMKNPSILLAWVEAGVMVQITAASLLGCHGHTTRDFSLKLVDHRMVHFVATDSHGADRRAPILSEARTVVEAAIGPEETRRIFDEYPSRIVRGEFPDFSPAVAFENRRPFIRRIFPFH